MCNKFIKTNHIGIAIGVFNNIPVGAKESCVTSSICHNNRLTRREVGDERSDSARVHIYTDSLVRQRMRFGGSHANEMSSITSGFVTAY